MLKLLNDMELEIIGENETTIEQEGEEEINHSYGSLLRLYVFFLLMFQSLFRLSDTALTILLKFFAMFFSTLSKTVVSLPEVLLRRLPRSVHDAREFAGSNRSTLQKFVCCPSCHSIYGSRLHL